MKQVLVGLLLGVVTLAHAFPADSNEDQDYLQMVARLAAAKGGDLFDSGNEYQYYHPSEARYPPDVLDFQEMLRGRKQEKATLMEDNDFFNGKLRAVANWPVQKLKLGQVGGVAVCHKDFPHVFHRASRSWTAEANLFDQDTKEYQKKEEGPINEPVLVRLNASNGAVVEQWGEGWFYLPHGLTIDKDINYWMTDVAMHQVFKYKRGENTPSLTLGKAFEPAKDNDDLERFCMPTDVAVASNGDFFVADGYCNQRVIKYNAEGKYVGHFGMEDLDIPHSLALVESQDLICVADRENMRVLCYDAGINKPDQLGAPEREYRDTELGMVYAIEYSEVDGVLYGVGTGNMFDSPLKPRGFTIDVSDRPHYSSDVIAQWSPNSEGFDFPHDLAVSPTGEAVYVAEVNTDGKNLWKMVKAGDEEELEEETAEEETDDGDEDDDEEDEEEEEEDN